jgi:hypothetical protein
VSLGGGASAGAPALDAQGDGWRWGLIAGAPTHQRRGDLARLRDVLAVAGKPRSLMVINEAPIPEVRDLYKFVRKLLNSATV